jgi:hypothetical protein
LWLLVVVAAVGLVMLVVVEQAVCYQEQLL